MRQPVVHSYVRNGIIISSTKMPNAIQARDRLIDRHPVAHLVWSWHLWATKLSGKKPLKEKETP